MRIKSFRIENYQCYDDTHTVDLDPGFNLVAGINNVGKSALLRALSLQALGNPHRSLAALPHRASALNRDTTVKATLSLTGAEFVRELRKVGGVQQMPAPQGIEITSDAIQGFLTSLEERDSMEVNVVLTSSIDTIPSWLAQGPMALNAYDVRTSNDTPIFMSLRVNPPSVTFDGGLRSRESREDVSIRIAKDLATEGVYRFDAERLNVSRFQTGIVSILAPNSANLAQVLNHMKQNEGRWARYVALLRRVFPYIQTVSVRPSNNGEAEISIWNIDPKTEREDLAIALDKCGSGVGQVLAMLYVLVTSDTPRVLLVDEPNSFLHPGASRALIRILREHPQHQYVVATHSPEVIAELGDARLLRIEPTKGAARILTYSKGNIGGVRQVLSDVGARLGDVLGFERLLWVEGPSEAAAFEGIAGSWFPMHSATVAFLPIRSTSDLESANGKDVLHTYRALSAVGAPMPPRVRFLLDREKRSAQTLTDLRRESNGEMDFLSRRLFENYLLNPLAISNLLGTLGERCEAEDITQWMVEHGSEKQYGAQKHPAFSFKWLVEVDGARILDHLFNALTEARNPYRKTIHTPALFAWIARNKPDELIEVSAALHAGLGIEQPKTVG